MSEENVEVVRRLIEHWEQGDWRWGRDVFDDECEAVFSASWFPEADNYRVGAEALRAWNGFRDAFETFEVRLDRIIDAGDRVVALTHIQARGQASGAAVDAFTGGIFTLGGGKIVRYVLTDSREALEAVGLPGVGLVAAAAQPRSPLAEPRSNIPGGRYEASGRTPALHGERQHREPASCQCTHMGAGRPADLPRPGRAEMLFR